jgi:phosphoribosylanthranilate isomerase
MPGEEEMMGRGTRVKVCGLTRLEDALRAAELGADFLGFVFAPSPRRLDRSAARKFWADLPSGVPRVGVFRDQKAREIAATVAEFPVDYLQLHGSESPAICRSFSQHVIKAFSPRSVKELSVIELYRGVADIFLVDLPKENPATDLLPLEVARAATLLGKPTLLAGGLDPENVGDFVRELHPWGVDVARGVEAEPGVKDQGKMENFFAAVRDGAAVAPGREP